MRRTLRVAAAVLAGGLAATGLAVQAQGGNVATMTAGAYWRTLDGQCVRTGSWSLQQANSACNPDLVRKPVPPRTPAPAASTPEKPK